MSVNLRLLTGGDLIKMATLKPIALGEHSLADFPQNLDIGANYVKGEGLADIFRFSPLDFICENPAEVRASRVPR
jgi:hypothetical protein